MKVEWTRIFLDDLDWSLTVEIGIRTLIMFLVVLTLLRLSGKKGVRQLSLFEVAIIISFGSAAGDPMFNKDVAVIPCIITLVSIILVYRLITWMAMRSERVESVLEGDPAYIIEDGCFVLEHENGHTFAKDEFLSEMRQRSIEHLGQVRVAILETNGMVSFMFYAPEECKYGMPVLPKAYRQTVTHISEPGKYACTFCGCVAELTVVKDCDRCGKNTWVKAINTPRQE